MDFLTELAAAHFLAVKPCTLQRWRWLKIGPRYHRIGRCIRYLRSDLESFARASAGPDAA